MQGIGGTDNLAALNAALQAGHDDTVEWFAHNIVANDVAHAEQLVQQFFNDQTELWINGIFRMEPVGDVPLAADLENVAETVAEWLLA